MMRFISFAILAVIYEAAIANGQTIKVDDAVLTEGEPLRIRCEISGFTSTDWVRWKLNDDYIEPDEKTILVNNTATVSVLEIKEATLADNSGNYTCVVSVHNGTDTFTQAANVKKAAHVKPFDKSKNLVQGDRLVLECKPQGDQPLKVTWNKNKEPFSHKTAEFKANTDNVENATLTIPSLEFEDKGDYMCIAENEFGSSNATVTVRVKDKLAALWPFLGICAEVAILCTVIFIYEKRRAKKMEEEEAKEEAGHLTNSYDNQKADVRQRK